MFAPAECGAARNQLTVFREGGATAEGWGDWQLSGDVAGIHQEMDHLFGFGRSRWLTRREPHEMLDGHPIVEVTIQRANKDVLSPSFS